MKSLFKLELKKALTNKMFILSTVIATILENRILLFKMSRQMLWTQTEFEIVKIIIKQEKQRGAIIIVACHDANILSEIADEIFVMENGSITKHIKNEV